MVTCPVCDGAIDVDEEDVDEGDTVSCDECGADLKVKRTRKVSWKTKRKRLKTTGNRFSMQATKLAALGLMVLLVAVPAGLAQKKKDSSTRSVVGVVTGPDEKPVTGAVVQLKDTKTKQVRSFYTQEKGDYYFHELSTDVEYELSASFQGASSNTRTLSVFDSRKEAVLNLKLNPKK
jgi:hypothetical protein